MRAALRACVDAALRPFGLAIGRAALIERSHRQSYEGAFDHVRRLQFEPRTVIDVGVASGTWPLYEAFPDSRIVLIEPVEEASPHLEAIAARFPTVEYVIGAADAEEGRIVLQVHRDIARTSSYWESDYLPDDVTRREVAAVTLDGLRRERGLQGPILLKVDVQGGELEVLRGATETLVDTEYVILECCLFQFFEAAPLLSQVVERMASYGFVPYDILSVHYRPLDGAVSTVDLAFVKASGRFRRVHRFQAGPLRGR